MSDKHTGEIILYQPDNTLKLEARLENETVWLSQAQMAKLFGVEIPAISKHINNIYKTGELEKISTVSILEIVQYEGNRSVKRKTVHFNLDMILSVGYRVNSKNATLFRRWATKTLKDYLLKGYVIHHRIDKVEKIAIETDIRVSEVEKKIDFFVKTALPPVQGIFFDGQIFDAYVFVSDLIKSAKQSITLIDNYVDESVLLLLSKRANGVEATIYTAQITPQLQLDLQKHYAQYPPVIVKIFTRSHDRFLFIDNNVYHIGASLKDLGRKWFAALFHHNLFNPVKTHPFKIITYYQSPKLLPKKSITKPCLRKPENLLSLYHLLIQHKSIYPPNPSLFPIQPRHIRFVLNKRIYDICTMKKPEPFRAGNLQNISVFPQHIPQHTQRFVTHGK